MALRRRLTLPAAPPLPDLHAHGALRDLRAGPFELAIAVGVPVGPVAIRGPGMAMAAGQLFIRPSRITVRILEPVRTVGMTFEDVGRLRAAVRARLMESVAPARPRSPG